jgi:LCP family protein required for cell wall assembly
VAGTAVVALLCVAVAAPPLVVARYAYVQRGLITSVFPDTEVTTVSEGGKPVAANDPWRGRQRLNLLLVASDAGADRTGTRTDSMVLLSTDVHRGDVMMFSLPRNLQHVPMPPGPLAQTWPGTFPDLLNAVYQRVTERPELLAGARDRGAEALKQVVGGILGLRVDYYVMINLAGFEKFVNALGGVTLSVTERLPIGGVLADGQHVAPVGYIEPGRQHMTGYTALWYARSRRDSSDYARMARQRCLIGAMARQASPTSVLAHFQELAGATKQLVATDLPQKLLQPLVDLAEQIRTKGVIRSLQFTPPLISTGDPDFTLIRTKVRQALAAPAAKSTPHATPTPPRASGTGTTKPGAPTGGTTSTTHGESAPSSNAESVDQACALP